MSEILAALMGFFAGMAGAILGVGGGIVFVPALSIFLDQNQLHAESTSLLAIIPVAAVAAWRQYGYGNVHVKDGAVIGVLSPIGVLIGVLVSNAVSERALELSFAALLLFVAARLVVRVIRHPGDKQHDLAPDDAG